MTREEQELQDIRRAYLLARALNTQYLFIREFVNPDLKKAINEANDALKKQKEIVDGLGKSWEKPSEESQKAYETILKKALQILSNSLFYQRG